jgi:hypothetical protein
MEIVMVTVSGERLRTASEVGGAEPVVMSVEDYALLRTNRRLAFRREAMPRSRIERIAGNRMSPDHADLDALMDDQGGMRRGGIAENAESRDQTMARP